MNIDNNLFLIESGSKIVGGRKSILMFLLSVSINGIRMHKVIRTVHLQINCLMVLFLFYGPSISLAIDLQRLDWR